MTSLLGSQAHRSHRVLLSMLGRYEKQLPCLQRLSERLPYGHVRAHPRPRPRHSTCVVLLGRLPARRLCYARPQLATANSTLTYITWAALEASQKPVACQGNSLSPVTVRAQIKDNLLF